MTTERMSGARPADSRVRAAVAESDGADRMAEPDGDDAVAHSRSALTALFGIPAKRQFDVRYWDGTVERGGGGGSTVPSPFTLVVARPGALRRMLLPPSELSIVEAYISGDVDVE